MAESWVCNHFALANPDDDRPTDLPHVLQRVADAIDARQIAPIKSLT